MASRLLVVCQLVLVLLSLGMASSNFNDDAYSNTGSIEGMESDVMLDEIGALDEIGDDNLSEEVDDDMTNFDENDVQGLAEDPMVARDIAQSVKRQILTEAKRLVSSCKNPKVDARNRKQERLTALRKYYQAFVHGGKSFISDANWLKNRKSEKCSACLLNELCKRTRIQRLLNIDTKLPAKEKNRICRRKLVREAMDVFSVNEITIQCNPNAPFRTINGTCNNLRNSSFGAASTTFNRLLPADYGDGISTLRQAVNGQELPNARDVSRFAHGSNADRTNPNSTILTHLAMNFAQFMDHDFTLAEAQGVNCEPPTKNPECINIEIPKDDAIFRDREVDFIELEREAPSESDSFCKLVPREHTNTLTAYIDASNVYGSTQDVADSLRAPNGLLKVMEHPDGAKFMDLLPARTETTETFCPSLDPNRPCFVAGDSRSNENQGLSSVHTVFVRHHNRIAKFFRKRTKWGPERIYQETRRIIAAQLQVITYNEFLPLFLSKKTITKFGLGLLKGTQFFNDYDETVNAQMTAGFSVAAFRFGHTLIQEWFRRFNQNSFQHKDKSEFRPIPVLDFENPQYLYEICQGGVDAILRGLIKDAAGKADGRFSSSVQENLRRGEGDLSDLISINIQRGRERGVSGYTKYRNLPLCGLPKVKSFKDLVRKAGFDRKDVANLRKIYKNVHDIDFFVAGMLEPRPSDGGVLGPTFQCIVAEQFRRLRVGDRFWHENAANPSLNTDRTAFNAAMLRQIRKTTFAKILCDNADDIPVISRKVLEQSNTREKCSALPTVSLEPWV